MTGTPGHSGRFRKRVFGASGEPAKPGFLPKEAYASWDYIIEQMQTIEPSVLCESDGIGIASLAIIITRMEVVASQMITGEQPCYVEYSTLQNAAYQWTTKLCLNPVARMRAKPAADKNPKNPLAALKKKAGFKVMA